MIVVNNDQSDMLSIFSDGSYEKIISTSSDADSHLLEASVGDFLFSGLETLGMLALLDSNPEKFR